MYPAWLIRCAFRGVLVLIALVSTLAQFNPPQGTANQLDSNNAPQAERNCTKDRVRSRR